MLQRPSAGSGHVCSVGWRQFHANQALYVLFLREHVFFLREHVFFLREQLVRESREYRWGKGNFYLVTAAADAYNLLMLTWPQPFEITAPE